MSVEGPFRRAHHNRIHKVLSGLDIPFFRENRLLFCGGTLVSLMHHEFRHSNDIDLIPDPSFRGYRALRERVSGDASVLFDSVPDGVRLGEPGCDQYGVRFAAFVDECPIKFAIFQEARLDFLQPGMEVPELPVLCLAPEDQMVEKLLANTERGMDPSVRHRDLYDLAMLGLDNINPGAAIERANRAYDVERSLDKLLNLLLTDTQRRVDDMEALEIDREYRPRVVDGLEVLAGFRGLDLVAERPPWEEDIRL